MQLQQITLRRQEAMLEFEDGRMPQAEAELSAIIEELRGAPNDTRFELCRSFLDRATVLSFANRWEEALHDLRECAEVAQQLKLINRRSILINVYQQEAKLYATPFASVFNPALARQALSNLNAIGFKGWLITQTNAELAYQERDWATAATGYREVAVALADEGWIRGVAACRLKSGRAFLEQNELDEAEADLSDAHSFLKKQGPADVLARAKIHTARLYVARGKLEEAWQLAEDALQLVESGIRKFGALLDQQRFVLDKLTDYEYAFGVALAKPGDEGVWRAWTVAERAKSFYLCQLVANADVGLFEGIDPTKLAKLRELEAELDQLEARMAQTPLNGGSSEQRGEIGKEFNRISQAKEKLQESLMRANPRWGALKTPPQLDLRAELKKLDPKWVPLSYFWETRDEGATLHIFSAGADRRPLHVTVEWSQAEIEKLDKAREKLRGRVIPILKVFPHELVGKIFPEALHDTLQANQCLMISPHDRLRMLPLHAMPLTEQKRLIDLSPVQYIPTLALLPIAPANKPAEKILLMGCEQDGFGTRPLKQVPQELDHLGQVWSKTRSGKTEKYLLASNGSPDQSGVPLTNWGEFDVLHLACHGDFPEDRPFDAALRLGKDAVRMSEFFGVRLNASLVSLSACSLARQTRQHSGIKLVGDEWVGLYLPLFYAGARGLLASLWDAYSEEAASFMGEMHRGLSEGDGLAEAFQKATQLLYDKPEPSWANWYLVAFPR